MTACAVVIGLHATWCISEAIAARGRKAIAPPPGRLASALAAGVLLVTAISLGTASFTETNPGLLLAGVLFGTAGIGLRLAAICRLGARFLDGVALLPSGHELETGGVYSLLRHPAELGFLLILLGTVLITDSTLAASILLTWVLPLSVIRMRREDRLLAPLR